MAATILKSRPIPIPSVDEHEDVARQTRQLHTLEQKLAAAKAGRATLVAEQSALQHAQREAEIARHLDDRVDPLPEDTDRATRLTDVAAQIARALEEEAVIAEAHDRTKTLAALTRDRVQSEINEQLRAQVCELLARMIPDVERLIEVNMQAAGLAERMSGTGFLVPTPGFFAMWLDGARRVAGGQ